MNDKHPLVMVRNSSPYGFCLLSLELEGPELCGGFSSFRYFTLYWSPEGSGCLYTRVGAICLGRTG